MRELKTRFIEKRPTTGRFICHVGPPKTATTAIQYALQRISGAHICYLGTNQPRSENKVDSIYLDLIQLVRDKADDDVIVEIQRKINQELEAGIDLILSEELFLVNQDNVRFEQKLLRLSQVIGCYPCIIVVSLRDPIAALKSYYLELYFRQALSPQISFEDFLVSEALTYDYPYLLDTLKKCGFENVRCVLIQREQRNIELSVFTGCQEHKQLLKLEHKNQTETRFRQQADALDFPEDLAAHLNKGYQDALSLAIPISS